MTRTEKAKLLRIAEHLESKSSDWMFKKTQELGFTDAEIGCLRATYDRKTTLRVKSNFIKGDN